jgi:hypothetical protein
MSASAFGYVALINDNLAVTVISARAYVAFPWTPMLLRSASSCARLSVALTISLGAPTDAPA